MKHEAFGKIEVKNHESVTALIHCLQKVQRKSLSILSLKWRGTFSVLFVDVPTPHFLILYPFHTSKTTQKYIDIFLFIIEKMVL